MSNYDLTKPAGKNILWYDQPLVETNPWGNGSEVWNHALPLGNGNMGVMVYGFVGNERYALNEDTIWYGGAGRNRVNPEAKENYLKIRQLLTEGRLSEAQSLVSQTMFPVPNNERHYESAQCVRLWCHGNNDTEGYQRYLDMNTATAVLEYIKDGVYYKREQFTSHAHDVFVIRLTSEEKMGFGLNLGSRDDIEDIKRIDENTLYVTTQVGGKGGCFYAIMARVVPDTVVKEDGTTEGSVEIHGDNINGKDIKSATIYLTIRSDFYGDDVISWCKEKLDKASSDGYEAVREAHIKEYQLLFNRTELNLFGDEEADKEKEKLPVNERLEKVKAGETDLGLISLYFQFGRYLLISSSRPGSQCANLQGIWNIDPHPPWGGKYTININTEMNYWLAENCNLSECHAPLFDLLARMYPNGCKVAQDMYGLEGFVAHHNTDLFGDCAPQDCWMPATIWPMGAAWICTHIMKHYDYSLDKEFLNQNLIYLRESCRFFTQYMFEDEKGRFVTGPSCSPENTYIHTSGEQGQMCIGPSMDSQILTDLFKDYLRAERILGVSDEIDEKVKEILSKLPKPSIGKYGQVMEWPEDYEETEPGHRHISHLYGLYPSAQFREDSTPELFAASRVTLERRLASGGGHTGWSRAWIINMWARLKDGEKAGENVDLILAKSTSTNLFDMHPPFQIDGNFGASAGIAEMLLQSHEDSIILMPAVPSSWKKGNVRGLVAKNNILVNFSFEDGNVTEATLVSRKGMPIILSLPKHKAKENPSESESEVFFSDEEDKQEKSGIEVFGNASYEVNGDILCVRGEGVFGVKIHE